MTRPYNLSGQLALYDPVTGTGALITEWIEDRSAMLSWKLKLLVDGATTNDSNPYVGGNALSQYFEDRASGEKIVLRPLEQASLISASDSTAKRTRVETKKSKYSACIRRCCFA